jgi:hypothetical protein
VSEIIGFIQMAVLVIASIIVIHIVVLLSERLVLCRWWYKCVNWSNDNWGKQNQPWV